MAEAWGVPPWVVGGLKGKRQRWYWRAVAWHRAENKRRKKDSKRG